MTLGNFSALNTSSCPRILLGSRAPGGGTRPVGECPPKPVRVISESVILGRLLVEKSNLVVHDAGKRVGLSLQRVGAVKMIERPLSCWFDRQAILAYGFDHDPGGRKSMVAQAWNRQFPARGLETTPTD